jgi:hypothetical protein
LLFFALFSANFAQAEYNYYPVEDNVNTDYAEEDKLILDKPRYTCVYGVPPPPRPQNHQDPHPKFLENCAITRLKMHPTAATTTKHARCKLLRVKMAFLREFHPAPHDTALLIFFSKTDPLHFELVDPCNFPKCGKLGRIIFVSGDLRSR